MTLFYILCRGGRWLPRILMSRSAMPPTVDDEPLEPHEGAHLNDQGHPGKRVRDEDGHPVDFFLKVLVRVVRLAHPDGRLGLIGDAAIPHDDNRIPPLSRA
jgi:hypothetical protein